MTETKRPPLTADEVTGLRVAGFSVVADDQLHEEAHRLAVETARADKAESRVRLAGDVFASLADLVAESLAAVTDGSTVDDLLLRLRTLREQLLDEAAFFAPPAVEVRQ